jgi:hypothetical protein
VAVLWAVLVAVLLTIAEPGSAVAPATSLESAAADAAVIVTGEVIPELCLFIHCDRRWRRFVKGIKNCLK